MTKKLSGLLVLFLFSAIARADLIVGDPAPLITLKTHSGSIFNLKNRMGHWTVLYFYPKAETPGCTMQACAFRDDMKKITALDAAVFGISSDTQEAQAKFHKKEALNFELLADPDMKAMGLYGTKVDGSPYAQRWTFIIDPELKIRGIEKNVDPVLDSKKTAERIAKLKNQR